MTGASLLFLILAVLNTARADPAVIRDIAITGNTVLSTREILDAFSSHVDLPFSPTIFDRDCRTLIDAYRARGYYEVDVLPGIPAFSTDSTSVMLAVTVREGKPSYVGRITIEGNVLLTESGILAGFETQQGAVLDEQMLEADIASLLERYARAGYPLAQCVVLDIIAVRGERENSLTIRLRVTEGRLVTIDEINVAGNTGTDPAVITRETRIQPGELYDPSRVRAIRERLRRLNIFADVEEPALYVKGNHAGLLITVREGNTNTFDGIIGYVPAQADGQPGYVSGLASVVMRNLFGTGRKLNVRWQREDRFSQELALRYVEPWVASLPVNIELGFGQRQQDTSYVKRGIDGSIQLMINEELSAALTVGSESVIPSGDSVNVRVFRSSSSHIGAGLQYDTRNDSYSPTSGARYRTDFEYGQKRVSSIPASLAGQVSGSGILRRVSLDLEFFLSPFRRQVIALGVHGRELQSGHTDESDLFRLGGARTLRGYRENQFAGSRVAWANLEYRFLLGRRAFAYAFADGGYYARPADPFHDVVASEAFKPGYGIGVQLDTALGVMGVSFALGQGDSFSNGKIHFGIVSDF